MNRAQRRRAARIHVARGGASEQMLKGSRKKFAHDLRDDVVVTRHEAEEQAAERALAGTPLKQRRSGLVVFRPDREERSASGLVMPK